MNGVALIDLSGMFWRYYHARANEAVNAARLAVVAEVHNVAREHEHCVICVDSPKNWRKERAAFYKANRPPHDQQALEQLRRTIETLRDDGFCILGADGHEADDVIASACVALKDHEVSIYSADKDLLACLRTDLAGPARVRVNIATYPPAVDTVRSLVEKIGIKPEQVPHWLALMGDKSDNVPGVEKCGHKTAAKWLQWFGSVDGVVRAACDRDDRLTEFQRRKVLEAADNPDCPLSLALELVTLKTDLPIDVDAVLAPRVAKKTDGYDDFPGEQESMPDSEQTPEAPVSKPATETVEAEFIARESSPGGNGSGETAIVKAPVSWELAFEPNDMRQAWWLANTVVKSRMFGAYGNPQSVLLVLMAGRELGMGAMASLRSFHVLEGRPTMSAQLMMAICRARRDLCKVFRVVKMTREAAFVETQRHDEDKPTEWSFTWKEAEEAGLTGKKNWRSYPVDMLVNRCIARAARFAFPEVCANIYDPDEIEKEAA